MLFYSSPKISGLKTMNIYYLLDSGDQEPGCGLCRCLDVFLRLDSKCQPGLTSPLSPQLEEEPLPCSLTDLLDSVLGGCWTEHLSSSQAAGQRTPSVLSIGWARQKPLSFHNLILEVISITCLALFISNVTRSNL